MTDHADIDARTEIVRAAAKIARQRHGDAVLEHRPIAPGPPASRVPNLTRQNN